jgi:ribosomal protein RSM22 (predicted rRNA methylase)
MMIVTERGIVIKHGAESVFLKEIENGTGIGIETGKEIETSEIPTGIVTVIGIETDVMSRGLKDFVVVVTGIFRSETGVTEISETIEDMTEIIEGEITIVKRRKSQNGLQEVQQARQILLNSGALRETQTLKMKIPT